MKVGFLLQRNFAHIGNILASILQEKYGVSEFCGYVYLRSSLDFLKQQKDVRYTSLILDEEIHQRYKEEKLDLEYLKNLEKEYGLPNLWHYLKIDRALMFNQPAREYPYNTPVHTYEEILRITQVTAKAVISFLEEEKPDFILFSAIGGVGSLLLYEIARKKNIGVLHIVNLCIDGRFALSETYCYPTHLEKIFEKNLLNQNPLKEKVHRQGKDFLKKFREFPHPYYALITPSQQAVERYKQLKFLWPGNLIKSVSWLAKIFYLHFAGKERQDYTYISPWNYLRDRVRRKIRNLVGLADLYDKYDPVVDFAFFPLHLEPEITTLLHAQFANDSVHAIKQFARSLPVGWLLYVKEHPQMVPFRPHSFYREIKKIPNARLINPAIPGFDLIKNAKLITTINGTPGWEGLLLKKPVVTLADVFYNRLSFVKNCRSYEKLPEVVREQINNFKYNEEELLNYLAAIYQDTAEVNLTHLWEEEQDPQKRKEGLKQLADLMAQKMGLKPL